MKLRAYHSQWTPFVEALCARTDVESAGIILAERLTSDALLARDFVPLPEAAYAIRLPDRIRIDPVALNRIIRPARDRGLSVLTVHTHPGTEEPWFSTADDLGDAVLMPSLFSQMDGPHGSLVIATETRSVAARAWTPAGLVPVSLSVVGKAINLSMLGNEQPPARWFDRQRLALGDAGQAVLRRLHVAVVGLGGTGSVTFLQLVHLGVGEITIIDGDTVEDANVSRIFGATADDAGITAKVEVAARYARSVGIGTIVNVHRGHLGTDVDPAVLNSCDAIFSCVDRHLPRALLNRLVYDKAQVLFDMGSAFRLTASDGMVGAGRVVLAGPGRPCLACWGHIDADRIRIESLPADERARQQEEGYIAGVDIPQPSVVAFNTQLAGAAVVEFLRCFTQFAGAEEAPDRLAFDFNTGGSRRNRLAATVPCSICQSGLAAKSANG